ncbi:conserved oligomeric Golgi complex subunit 5 [Amborella trichopoda]|uniref:Conserved oligomeric Golgi complex subunit 5 n=1 Tax=Amborella trichopoda TaxID=13333 RepID=W1PV88_AMBTC|nr:conserved oligomeric Golgi complex subunit 5 [Amborella trichopoda]XP_020526444.1 conserved oligomeric Golgi complex subunit 5 [Amborella trichopoda]ERN11729.1 hypothetical protein AMTR_s00022p00236320 [Amborella trichopoda]|eukprot:XP_006850148.1 conserved oligomeric Golgi complex subunit 5 [Amborella trichopoda]
MASPTLQRLPSSSLIPSTTPSFSSTSPPSDPLSSFQSDPTFSPFLSPDFNPSLFSSHALSSGSPASRAEKLKDAISLLDSHLRSLVSSNHPSLFQHLHSLSNATSALSVARSATSSLRASLARARADISEPHRQIKLKTSQLRNLHETSILLQATLRAIRLISKLHDLMDMNPIDLSKSAQLYSEIIRLIDEAGLRGLQPIDEHSSWLSDVGAELRKEAMAALQNGLQGLNQAEVGGALQVFYNLGELRATVETLILGYKNQGMKAISGALDMKAISVSSGGFGGPGGGSRSGTPQIGGGAKAKEGLWRRLGDCMDQIHGVVVAVWHLQRVLSKKRDPFTHVLFLEEVLQEGDPVLTERVWEALVKSFASQMKSAFTASSFVKETLTKGYPKLFSMIENLLERISRDTDVKGVLPAISSEGKEQMAAAIESFQTSFLALCLSRLSDHVNSVFPMSNRGSIPSKDQILGILSEIQKEIQGVKLNGHLTLLVLHEIGKILLLLAERTEYQISTGPESRQVTGPATPLQLKNFTLCLHLQEVHTRAPTMILDLPIIARDVLSPSLAVIYEVACDSITPLFQSMLDRLENCILKIHDQNFGSHGAESSPIDNMASEYMDELQKSITHFRTEFLSRLLPSSSAVLSTETICTSLVRRMASRVLVFFIRHAALVRPLSESGKLRLARAMAELELVVGQSLFPIEQLGPPYRALRAFRPIIFLETSQLEVSPLLRDLPPSVILHHLYSRGPDELESPMQRNKLTPVQYSLWLDSQGEDQVWKGIKATLDDYASKVGARGDKEFSPVYPLMLRLGSSLVEGALELKKA